MDYPISIQPMTPKLDAIPVYKITCYPLEQRDYKPFAQVRLCMTPQDFWVQMWAFEARPRPESTLKAVFTLPSCQTLLEITADAQKNWACAAVSPSGRRPVSALAHSLDGEDLQGVFWGMSILLKRSDVEEALGKGCTEAGQVLLGNVYKLSDSPEKPHRGSLFPAAFGTGREYALESMARFPIVSY